MKTKAQHTADRIQNKAKILHVKGFTECSYCAAASIAMLLLS